MSILPVCCVFPHPPAGRVHYTTTKSYSRNSSQQIWFVVAFYTSVLQYPFCLMRTVSRARSRSLPTFFSRHGLPEHVTTQSYRRYPTCFRRTGSRAGSSSVPTFSSRHSLPEHVTTQSYNRYPTCFRRTGSRAGSRSVPTFSSIYSLPEHVTTQSYCK